MLDEISKHWAPKVVVSAEEAHCVHHFFEMQHGIEFNWCEALGFTFKDEKDRVVFELKFDDWTRPFLHVGQVFEIDIVCLQENGNVAGWIKNKLVECDKDALKRMLSRM